MADRIRKGYTQLGDWGYTHLLRIRGDNYCAIRASIFQTLSIGKITDCSLLANVTSPEECVDPMFVKYPFLENWSFGNKEDFSKLGTKAKALKICIANLVYQLDKVNKASHRINGIVHFFTEINTNTSLLFECSIMEAIKFFMFIKSAEYWELLQEEGELPNGMEHFFLRESALTLQDFLYNHLNDVGSVGGLEMIEMCLLGYTLGLQIRVYRISSFGREDFITFYPPGDYPEERIINISAEDDRHYNVVTTLTNEEEFFIYTNTYAGNDLV